MPSQNYKFQDLVLQRTIMISLSLLSHQQDSFVFSLRSLIINAMPCN